MSSVVSRTLPAMLMLFFFRTLGYRISVQALDFRNPLGLIAREPTLRGSLAAGQDALIKDINALMHLSPPGCPPESAFRLRSTSSERSNACYTLAASSELSEAYSSTGKPLEVDDGESWGQGYVMSFITFSDTIVRRFRSSFEDSEDSYETSPKSDSSLEDIRMVRVTAGFDSALTVPFFTTRRDIFTSFAVSPLFTCGRESLEQLDS